MYIPIAFVIFSETLYYICRHNTSNRRAVRKHSHTSINGTHNAGGAPVVSHISPGRTRRSVSTAEALGTLASVAGKFVRGVQRDSAVVEAIQNPSLSMQIE